MSTSKDSLWLNGHLCQILGVWLSFDLILFLGEIIYLKEKLTDALRVLV